TRAAQRLRHISMPHRLAAHVRLVDHRVVPGNPRWPVITPGEGRVGDAALGRARRAVTLVEGKIRLGASQAVAEMGIAPDERAFEPLGVGLDQQLVWIEPQSLLRSVWPVDPVAIEEPGPGLGKVAVPDLICALAQRDPLRLVATRGIEETQLHFLGAGREE